MTKKVPDKTDGVRADVAAFLDKAAAVAPPRGDDRRGRLCVVIDATMSREPTWDAAVQIQAEMFQAAAAHGGLLIDLVFFRGFNECRSSGWVGDPATLARKMTAVRCRAGRTQIQRALEHVRRQAETARVRAFVYVGDACEENVDLVCDAAGQLGMRGVRGFVFHEGGDPIAGRAFREIARLTNGAYLPFDVNAAGALRGLMGAAAAYAAGGGSGLLGYAKSAGGDADRVARLLPPTRGE